MEITEGLKISIITVCKNSEQFLNETINSVIQQSYKSIEYIIIDGKSTDSTTAIISRYAMHIHYWISEEDSGMYDALNKGLKKATGDYILVLNSDDLLAHDNIIEEMVKEMRMEQLDYYYGSIIKLKNGKYQKIRLFNVTYSQLLLSTHSTFVPHPSFFISRQLNEQLEGYDLNYKYASDYDYILRALNTNGVTGKYINMGITKFRLHRGSISSSGKIDKDRKRILLKHNYYKSAYIKRVFCYYSLWMYYKIINPCQKFKAG